MAFQIQYAEEHDAPALARINILSFETQGLLQALFPGAETPALELHKANNYMKHLANRQMHVVKVTDPLTGELVGNARWQLPEAIWPRDQTPALSEKAQEIAQDPMRLAPRPRNEALLAGFRTMLEHHRKKYLGETDLLLDFLATTPSYQGRGVGSALLRWGTAKADEKQLRIYLEATEAGYPVYVKHGWKVVEEVFFDREQFGGHGRDRFILMMRDPKPLAQSATEPGRT
ncbi:hypothetical protein N7539_005985 [Penicillium diatomitis]|uniref:N-acetyltransferase domain-containing protein n=1 Tax=Penicillium diatomitis TaxID=2819901 RepID=A0A9W9X6N9_9EURO|nr:uncharacterized protein N7539_005985 [Penicillium diatomitis]KAJ5484189.1 hypothetical protein N7539_005985 [Penicillium diatomitis]